jgi:hypothetical protein
MSYVRAGAAQEGEGEGGAGRPRAGLRAEAVDKIANRVDRLCALSRDNDGAADAQHRS